MAELDDKELLSRTIAGDKNAFGDLIRRHQAYLRAYAARYIANSDDVLDIVQDTFLNAYRNIASFDLEKEFLPWIRSICRNRVFNHLRSRKCRTDNQSLVDSAVEDWAASGSEETPDQLVERVEKLRRCMDKVGEPQKHLLKMHYTMNRQIKDIAAELKRTAGSIYVQLMRLRRELAACVENKRDATT